MIARADRSQFRADRDGRSQFRADKALERRPVSPNAADISSAHATFETLMIDLSPTPAEITHPQRDNLGCPNFTTVGKENFTKNLNEKVTVIVNKV